MTTAAPIATARAYPNIALVKYWGKRDEQLMLPVAGSLSMTLDALPTTTTVSLTEEASDSFELNGVVQSGSALTRVSRFLDLVRQQAVSRTQAQVVSQNEAPTAAGLASSASGFAALALAASKAYGLDLNPHELSRLARRGSGSASRSTVDRFALWHAGTDDASSYAEQIDAPDMRMIIVTINGQQKAVSSREGMRHTANTSPFWQGWVTSTETLLQEAASAARAHDFTKLGELTEIHAMRMHAVIMSSAPPIRYLAPASFAVFDALAELRQTGIETYGTADAGPNVVAIARPADAAAVAARLAKFGATRVVAPGSGASLLDSPLSRHKRGNQ